MLAAIHQLRPEQTGSLAPGIVNLSEMAPQWNWVSAGFPDATRTWRHVSSQSVDLPPWLPRRTTLSRLLAGRRAANLLKESASVLVTHGPRSTLYGALLAGRQNRNMRHLAFSFNFTRLPTGMTRRLMVRAFQSVERFAVFSSLECTIYADYFDLQQERFDMLHWGVRAPEIDWGAAPSVSGDYICAIGSQGRDYKTLLLAMKRLPGLRLVVVAAPDNLSNIEIPDNVTIKTDIPLAQAMNILAHSRFMALPLNGSQVPCGHVTIVSAMHLGKAVIATGSSGLDDYVKHGVTGLSCPEHDVASWVSTIQSLHDDPAKSLQLGLGGQLFARKHCTESNVVEYFRRFLKAQS